MEQSILKELIKMIDVRNIGSKVCYWVLLYVVITPSLLLSQDPPEEFQFEQSMLQAFYFFNNIYIDGENISSDDWVGAFKGDVCVGARKWDTNE